MRATALRVDPETGIREAVRFLEAGPQRILAFTHLPAGEARAGVVVCSPIKAELMKNYRREVLLARHLATRGLAVQRFHYRGTGHSEGATEDLTVDDMIEDARVATGWLCELAGVRSLAFLGTRVGSWVAAAVAAEHHRSPLALWEPIVDPERYFREIFRARLVRELKEGTEAERPSTETIRDRLTAEGSVDILGYSIDRRLYESLCARDPLGELDGPRPVLVVQIGNRGGVRPGTVRLNERLRDRGCQVEATRAEGDAGWWFDEMAAGPQKTESSEALLETTHWLARRLAEATRP